MRADTVEIETRRTKMRELVAGDVEALIELANDPEVTHWVDWALRERDALQAFVAAAIAARAYTPRLAYLLAVEEKGDGRVLGFLRLHDMKDEQAELSIYFLRGSWGLGLATECATALRDFAFAKLEIRRIIAYCDVDNAASARVLEKTGFTREGTVRARLKLAGAWRDSYLYAIETL